MKSKTSRNIPLAAIRQLKDAMERSGLDVDDMLRKEKEMALAVREEDLKIDARLLEFQKNLDKTGEALHRMCQLEECDGCAIEHLCHVINGLSQDEMKEVRDDLIYLRRWAELNPPATNGGRVLDMIPSGVRCTRRLNGSGGDRMLAKVAPDGKDVVVLRVDAEWWDQQAEVLEKKGE